MKKIRCQLCDSVWMVEDDDLNKQKVCPCCETSIQQKVEFDTYDSLDKVIYGAIAKMEKEGLQKEGLQNIQQWLDTVPGLEKEKRIFSRTVTDKYTTHIRVLFDQDMDEAETTIIKLKQLFMEEEGLSETWADIICEALYGAAMYYNGYGTTKMINVTVEDILVSNMESSSCSTNTTFIYSNNCHKVNNIGKDEETFRTILDKAGKKLSENNTEAALEEYRMAANGGYVPAYNLIGSIYYSKENYKRAWKWYLKAAEANDSEGQYYVGLFYQKGIYVQKDIHMAVKYFKKSLEKNNINALVALVDVYTIHENEIQEDLEKVIMFLTTAAEGKNTKAQYKLAEIYQNGNIIGKDIMKAAHWYQQVAMLGDSEAKQRLEECVSEMSFKQKFKWKLHNGLIN